MGEGTNHEVSDYKYIGIARGSCTGAGCFAQTLILLNRAESPGSAFDGIISIKANGRFLIGRSRLIQHRVRVVGKQCVEHFLRQLSASLCFTSHQENMPSSLLSSHMFPTGGISGPAALFDLFWRGTSALDSGPPGTTGGSARHHSTVAHRTLTAWPTARPARSHDDHSGVSVRRVAFVEKNDPRPILLPHGPPLDPGIDPFKRNPHHLPPSWYDPDQPFDLDEHDNEAGSGSGTSFLEKNDPRPVLLPHGPPLDPGIDPFKRNPHHLPPSWYDPDQPFDLDLEQEGSGTGGTAFDEVATSFDEPRPKFDSALIDKSGKSAAALLGTDTGPQAKASPPPEPTVPEPIDDIPGGDTTGPPQKPEKLPEVPKEENKIDPNVDDGAGKICGRYVFRRGKETRG